MAWAEEGLFFCRLPVELGRASRNHQIGKSSGRRNLYTGKACVGWGFPISLQYKRPLGFGNLARRVGRL